MMVARAGAPVRRCDRRVRVASVGRGTRSVQRFVFVGELLGAFARVIVEELAGRT